MVKEALIMNKNNRQVPVIDDRPITYDECIRFMDELDKRDEEVAKQDEIEKKRITA